ncbi:hypothetical protein PT277_03560 [Acetobacteraceae bacterium ESL0709]|nr:hypothetical protein [Acetobacteraceae bacterium ESL0697]MDF7677777.1 hypothetical protein [Acetobacteraceae bacterium ESL0709]
MDLKNIGQTCTQFSDKIQDGFQKVQTLLDEIQTEAQKGNQQAQKWSEQLQNISDSLKSGHNEIGNVIGKFQGLLSSNTPHEDSAAANSQPTIGNLLDKFLKK